MSVYRSFLYLARDDLFQESLLNLSPPRTIMGDISRLALCSKILFDQEVLDLRQRVADLEKQAATLKEHRPPRKIFDSVQDFEAALEEFGRNLLENVQRNRLEGDFLDSLEEELRRLFCPASADDQKLFEMWLSADRKHLRRALECIHVADRATFEDLDGDGTTATMGHFMYNFCLEYYGGKLYRGVGAPDPEHPKLILEFERVPILELGGVRCSDCGKVVPYDAPLLEEYVFVNGRSYCGRDGSFCGRPHPRKNGDKCCYGKAGFILPSAWEGSENERAQQKMSAGRRSRMRMNGLAELEELRDDERKIVESTKEWWKAWKKAWEKLDERRFRRDNISSVGGGGIFPPWEEGGENLE